MLLETDARAVDANAQMLSGMSAIDQAGSLLELNSEDGMVWMKSNGRWSAADCDRYLTQSKIEFMRARAKSANVCLLADVREAEFSAEAEDQMRKNMGALLRPGDRAALVVRSSLAKMQLRQSIERQDVNYFLSVDAARMWLGVA